MKTKTEFYKNFRQTGVGISTFPTSFNSPVSIFILKMKIESEFWLATHKNSPVGSMAKFLGKSPLVDSVLMNDKVPSALT